MRSRDVYNVLFLMEPEEPQKDVFFLQVKIMRSQLRATKFNIIKFKIIRTSIIFEHLSSIACQLMLPHIIIALYYLRISSLLVYY